MQLYPALDLRGGRVARALDATDPLDRLAVWQAAGATWVHLVDMDRAEGIGNNTALLARLLRDRVGLRVQVGGGLAGDAVAPLLAAGADRVIVGSAGVATLPDLLARHGADRIGFALDLRDGTAWTPDGMPAGEPLALFAAAIGAGVRTVIVRDLSRDGTLTGVALELLAPFQRDNVDVVLAGGIQSLDDLGAARAAGAAGVIVGRALLQGRFGFAEALACCG